MRLTILGSGSGLPTAHRDTCCLLVDAGAGPFLVDCAGGIVSKLARAEVALPELRHVVLTHDHVDHVYGLAHLLHARAVHGGCDELAVRGPAATLRLVEGMVRLHGLTGPRYPTLQLQEVPLVPGSLVYEDAAMRVTATPVEHGRDTIGLRFDAASGSLTHSSDTRYSEALIRLGASTDLLLHDCGGLHADRESGFGDQHASAQEAGRAAAAANAGQLLLMHLPGGKYATARDLEREASAAFGRPVRAARDGESILL